MDSMLRWDVGFDTGYGISFAIDWVQQNVGWFMSTGKLAILCWFKVKMECSGPNGFGLHIAGKLGDSGLDASHSGLDCCFVSVC